jgi:hypothetical protein
MELNMVTAKHIILRFPKTLVLSINLKAGLLVNLRRPVENPYQPFAVLT